MGKQDPLTHFNEQNRARMVDISGKEISARTAIARSQIRMKAETLKRIKQGRIDKGDVLAVAQVAGIMAAKKTSEWIPMCHPLALTGVDIVFTDNEADTIFVEVTAKTTGMTGAEMEALTAASAVVLTIYDMCKALDKGMILGPTWLESKTGGKSGDFVREN